MSLMGVVQDAIGAVAREAKAQRCEQQALHHRREAADLRKQAQEHFAKGEYGWGTLAATAAVGADLTANEFLGKAAQLRNGDDD